jgi:hypothetical protein
MRHAFTTPLAAAFGCALVIANPAAMRAQEVGTAAAVNPSAQARGQGGSRTIMIGQSIAHRERIQTTSAGSVQLLFIDKTSMTIGPNSDLAIDEYVFDPQSNTGKLSATLAKGVMRFVGGQVSHSGSAQIATPNGVVGIRGGVGIIGTQHVFIGFGRGTVTSGSSSVTLDAGEYTHLAPGAPPTSPGPPPPGLIASLLQNFQSQPGQGGGAPASANTINQARASITGSSNGPVVTATPPVAPENLRQATQPVSTVNQTVALTTNQQIALYSLPPPQPPPTPSQTPLPPPLPVQAPPPAPAPPPLTQTPPIIPTSPPSSPPPSSPPPANPPPPQYGSGPAFTFSMSNCCGQAQGASNVPYLPASFATGPNRFVSQGMGYRAPAQQVSNLRAANVGSSAPPTYFQWGIGINGSGASQSSWLSVMTGELADSGDGVTFSGGFGATRRGAGNQTMGRASGFASSTAGSVVLDDKGIPLSATVNQQDYVAATNQYRNVQAQFSTTGTGALTNYAFTQQVARTVAPTGLGQYRPDQVLTGWTGGLMQTTHGSSVSAPFATAGIAQIILDPSRSRVQATFDVVNMTPSFDTSFLFGTFQMGSLNSSQRPQSAYVDYENFAAREAVTVNPNGTQQTQLSTVNLQRAQNSTTIMVNVPRDVARQVLPNTTICECEFTRWGFWSTDTQRAGPFGGSRNDRGHMMTWVAGQLPNVGEVPKVGTATYTGHVVANVNNAGAQYIASGSLTNIVNFNTGLGSSRVDGFDNRIYTGSLVLNRQDPRFLGAGLTSGDRTMLMTGSFFRGSQGPVGEMGGNVLVGGRNYLGSGIFAGAMR